MLSLSIKITGQTIIPIVKKDSVQFDFSPIKSFFENKRIVCLGEHQHRVETFLQLKDPLLKYLHEELDYEVVAFECSLFNISNAYYNISSDTAGIEEAFYRVWRTKKHVESL